MGHFLCCWKCTKDQNDTTTHAGEGLRDEFVEAEEENPKWLASFHAESEKEQCKRAIALAAATAAAADAAVAAAHAAVAVVRLTSRRSDWHDRYWAAVKIQSAFRAYLARKALRALKALVKLQALVKGHLVRKQTALALQGMQTLMRIQTTMQSRRFPISLCSDAKSQLVSYHRRSLETQQISSRSSSPKTINSLACFQETQQMSSKSSSPKTNNTDTGSSFPFSSPLPIQIPPHLSLPRSRNLRERSMTASSTPRSMTNECNGPHCPSYLASTRSFDAKVRSQSAPKQRAEYTELMKRRVSFNESRGSLSGLSKEGVHSYKNAVAGRIDKYLELSREDGRDYYLMKRW